MHPFDETFVCADAGIYKKGHYIANLGLALEIRDYQDFRNEYFNAIDGLSSKYGVRFLKKIIKASDIYRIVPDHNLSAFITELVEILLSSDKILTVQATHTILQNPVRYPWQTREIPGIKFVENHLSNYYAVIPVFEYYHNGGTSEAVVLDGVTGFMTKAWSEVARKASKGLYIVPHGDETHPCISTCDLTIMAIKHKVYPLTAESIEDFLSARVSEKTRVYSDFVSDGMIDWIRAKYSHSIKPQKYYLHPLYLIDRGEDLNERVIRQTDVYSLAHETAERHGGSSFNIKVEDELAILQPGDVVICLTDESYKKMNILSKLNPRRGIEVFSVEEFLEKLEREAEAEIGDFGEEKSG